MEFKETKEILRLGFSIGEALAKSLDDSQLDLTDLPNFVAVIPTVAPAVIGAHDAKEEIENAKDNDWEELVRWAKEEFDIPQDNVEQVIEEAMTLGLAIAKFVTVVRLGK